MICSIPILRVKRLKPAFDHKHHIGTMSRRRAISRIETDAAFARDRQIASLTNGQKAGRG